MGAIEHLTISLSPDMAARMRAWVASGDYASMEAVVLDALLAWNGPEMAAPADPGAEHWLRTVAVRAYDAHLQDPSRAIPVDEVVAGLQAARIARGG